MSIVAIQLNDQPLNLPDVTTTPGENVLKLAYDRKNWPRVTINNQNVNSVDGKTWKITLPVGLSTLRVQHWNDATQVNDTDKTFKIVANRPVPKPQPNQTKLGIVDLDKKPYVIMKPLIDGLPVQSTRTWVNSNGFKTYSAYNFTRVIEYAKNGVKPIFCIAQSGLLPQPEENIRAWVDAFATDADAALGDNWAVEAGNEPNLTHNGVGDYWDVKEIDGTIRTIRYIRTVQKPIFEAVKAVNPNVEVIAAGLSWDSATLERVADESLKYANSLAFHPYPNDLTIASTKRIAESVQTARNRNARIIFTELGMSRGKQFKAGQISKDAWAKEVTRLIEMCITEGVDEICYFPAFDAGTTNSPAALFDGNIQPTVFLKALKDGFKV